MGSRPRWARTSHTRSFFLALDTPQRLVPDDRARLRLSRRHTGLEMAHHAMITAALSLPVFVCDPHHPWQRGTNENTNRLLRQYLHKNADLGSFTLRQLNTVASKLNDRPRQILGWATPAEALGVAWPQPMPLMPA